jgi:periplasmic protein TonB
MFAQAQTRLTRPWTFPVSVSLQVLALGTAIVVPLIRIEPMPPVRLVARKLAPPHVLLVDVPQAFNEIFRRPTNASTFVYRTPFQLPTARFSAQQPSNEMVDGTALPDIAASTAGTDPASFASSTAALGAVRPPTATPTESAPKQQPVAVEQPVAAHTYRAGGDVKPPVLRLAPPPAYPQLARAARVQGTVVLNGVISKDGTVRSVELVRGHPLLVAAAINAVKSWQYESGRLNGQPVDVQIVIEVNFRLAP